MIELLINIQGTSLVVLALAICIAKMDIDSAVGFDLTFWGGLTFLLSAFGLTVSTLILIWM